MRIYQNTPLDAGMTLCLDQAASHHLARVLRVKIGDRLTLFNGSGGEYEADVTIIDKKAVTVRLHRFLQRDMESPLKVCLAQGIARGEKMDFILQKSVELGVHEIVPLITARTNVQLDEKRKQQKWLHWQSVVVSACEQSGRNRLPKLHLPIRLSDWLMQAEADLCYVLTPHTKTLLNGHTRHPKSIVLLVGPEGGLSEEEVAASVKMGFLPLHLGPRILRTETAGLAAQAIFQSFYGDMGGNGFSTFP